MTLSSILNQLGGSLKLTILSYMWVNRKMYPSELATELKISRTQISRELSNLEDDGLIIKTKEEGNYVSVSLSSKCVDMWIQLLEILVQDKDN